MTPTLATITVIISSLAAIISLITLYKTHLSKFKPVITVGILSMRIYPIKSGERQWFIPSFHLPISISNDGARPGKILGLRLVVSYPDLPIPNNYEIFSPEWEIDSKEFKKNSKERFVWLEDAKIRDWMPFVVLPKNTLNKDLIFETRWEDPVIQKNVDVRLEIFTESNKKWDSVITWKAFLPTAVWSMLETGSSISVPPQYQIDKDETVYPKDLHKYTGTKESMPSKIKSESSYLNYKQE